MSQEVKNPVEAAKRLFELAMEYRDAEISFLDERTEDVSKFVRDQLDREISKNLYLDCAEICCGLAIRFQNSGIIILQKVVKAIDEWSKEMLQNALKEFEAARKYRLADTYGKFYEIYSEEDQIENEFEEVDLETKKKLFTEASIHQKVGICLLCEVLKLTDDSTFSSVFLAEEEAMNA